MEVGQLLGMSHGTGGVAELHVGVFLGSLDQEGLMAEGVGEDDVAILDLDQLNGCFVASVGLGDLGLLNHLHAHGLTSGLGSVDEVLVVGRVLVMQEDEAHLQFVLGNGSHGAALGAGFVTAVAAGSHRDNHHSSQQQSNQLFHFLFLQYIFLQPHLRHRKHEKNSPHKRDLPTAKPHTGV